MLTECVVSLGKSEEWFWDSELRIVWNLLEKHKEIEKVKQKNLAIYIASFVWGHNPDEDEEEQEILGRDKPISESAIRGLIL